MAGVRRTQIITPEYRGHATWLVHGYLVYKIYGDEKERYIHREIMEEFIGRKLDSIEIVHHINEDRLDNRIENLEVLSMGEHFSLHNKKLSQLRHRNNKGQFI